MEKLAKGIYSLYTEEEVPLIHNIWSILNRLVEKVNLGDYLDFTEFQNVRNKHKEFLVELLSYYISTRYPTYKEKVSASISEERAVNILETTEEVFAWIESLSQYKK